MSNPFEDETQNYHVLVNDEGQYSLWPAWLDVPGGWEVRLGDTPRAGCLELIEREWTDLRPKSLIAAAPGV
ncbi:MbtH family protein [Kitasatospora sp. NPDC096147]|uniref:MbtH family protein n=1 Tax=Kitasatospora sp. NPDC096147 TaxID=3364093 RepID=UPI00380E50F1